MAGVAVPQLSLLICSQSAVAADLSQLTACNFVATDAIHTADAPLWQARTSDRNINLAFIAALQPAVNDQSGRMHRHKNTRARFTRLADDRIAPKVL